MENDSFNIEEDLVALPEVDLTEEQVEEVEGPKALDLPKGLTLTKVENLAAKWHRQWDDASNELIETWKRNRELYRKFEKRTDSKITYKVPVIFAQIQTELPHLVDSVFSKSEIVKPYPKEEIDPDTVLKVKNYINKQIIVSCAGRRKITDVVQNFLIYGTSVAKTFWDYTPARKFDVNTNTWNTVENVQPNFIPLDIFDFMISPDYRGYNVQEAEWAAHKLWLSKDELKKLRNKKEIENVDESIFDVNTSESQANAQDTTTKPISGEEGKGKNPNKIGVIEYWATITWEIDGELTTDEFYFWMLEDKCIKFKHNDYATKPFVSVRCYRMSDTFFGLSEVDVMKAYAAQMGDIHTKAGMLAKKVGQKLTYYEPSSGFDAQRAKRTEDGMVILDDGGLSKIRTEDTTAGQDLGVLVNYLASLNQNIQNATGINDILQGEEGGDKTAAEASILNQNGSARMREKLKNLQDEFLVPLAAQMYCHAQQLIINHTFSYQNNMYSLTKEDFAGEYDWIALGTLFQSNKAVRNTQLTNLAQQLTAAAQIAPAALANGFDVMSWMKNEVMPGFDIADPDRYFPRITPSMASAQEEVNPDQSNTQGLPPEMPISAPNLGSMEGSANSIEV